MRARRFASRQRRQFLSEDDLVLAREAMTGGRAGGAIEPSEGLPDVARQPTLSVKLGDLVELG